MSTSLHFFADASTNGYGPCAFARFQRRDGSFHCRLVLAKARTAPLKLISIPRLELQAAVLAVRLSVVAKNQLTMKLDRPSVFWTDSQTVLQFVNNDSRRFHTYVAHRVAEIREETDPAQWRHCPGKLNPADHAPRGLDAEALVNAQEWFDGPRFLSAEESAWPAEPTVSAVSDNDVEVKPARRQVHCAQVSRSLDKLLNYYGTWTRLRRGVAYIIRFCQWLLSRRTPQSPNFYTRISATPLTSSFVTSSNEPIPKNGPSSLLVSQSAQAAASQACVRFFAVVSCASEADLPELELCLVMSVILRSFRSDTTSAN